MRVGNIPEASELPTELGALSALGGSNCLQRFCVVAVQTISDAGSICVLMALRSAAYRAYALVCEQRARDETDPIAKREMGADRNRLESDGKYGRQLRRRCSAT